MRNKLMLVVACALLFSACSKDAADVNPTTANVNELGKKGGTQRPIKGSFVYTVDPQSDLSCDCGSYFPVGTFSGAGNLSHLGNATSHIKPCVSPLIQGGVEVGMYVGVECAYFRAANGDSLYCYTQPYNLYYGPQGAVGACTVDFTGGTGRFANASGRITGIVTVGPTGGTFTNITGTISY